MNCWEILGIDPTRDREAIDRAYEQQKKFAEGEDLDRLKQAYWEASGLPDEAPQSQESGEPGPETELSAQEQQVVREVVIQVKALLNDSRRSGDEGIWRAILTEPPADQTPIRAAVGQALAQQVRPSRNIHRAARSGSVRGGRTMLRCSACAKHAPKQLGPPQGHHYT